jgi:predicted ABC-type transport system involved in lysophospholipase L1 biosynthesis ATPase subunit
MNDRRRTDYRARRMGFIFQVYNLLPVLSAVENVELPLLVSGTRPKEARAGPWRPSRRSGSRTGPPTGRPSSPEDSAAR